MQALDVLSSYARRRGYIEKNSDCEQNLNNFSFIRPKFVPKLDGFRFKNSPNVEEELEKYVKFLKLLSSDDRTALIPLNIKIIDRFNAKYSEIREELIVEFRRIALIFNVDVISSNFINERLIKNLIHFVEIEETFILGDVIKIFLEFEKNRRRSLIKIESDIDRDEEESVHFASDSAFPPIFDEILPGWLKIRELNDEISKRNEEDSNSSSDVLFYYRLANCKNQILSIDLSDDRRYLVGGTERGEIFVRNLKYSNEKEPKLIKNSQISVENSSIFCVKVLNKSQDYFLFGSENGSVCVARADNSESIWTYFGHRYPVLSVDIEPDDQFFITSSFDRTARLFTFEDSRPLRVFAGHSDAVQCARFVQGMVPGVRPLIATASSDKTLMLWSQEQAVPVRVVHCLNSFPTLISSCPTKNLLACASADKKLFFYDLRNDKTLQILDLQDFLAYAMNFDDRGSFFATGSNGRVKLFEWDSSSCTYGDEAKRAFSVPGDGIVYCFKPPDHLNPYLTCVTADFCV